MHFDMQDFVLAVLSSAEMKSYPRLVAETISLCTVCGKKLEKNPELEIRRALAEALRDNLIEKAGLALEQEYYALASAGRQKMQDARYKALLARAALFSDPEAYGHREAIIACLDHLTPEQIEALRRFLENMLFPSQTGAAFLRLLETKK